MKREPSPFPETESPEELALVAPSLLVYLLEQGDRGYKDGVDGFDPEPSIENNFLYDPERSQFVGRFFDEHDDGNRRVFDFVIKKTLKQGWLSVVTPSQGTEPGENAFQEPGEDSAFSFQEMQEVAEGLDRLERAKLAKGAEGVVLSQSTFGELVSIGDDDIASALTSLSLSATGEAPDDLSLDPDDGAFLEKLFQGGKAQKILPWAGLEIGVEVMPGQARFSGRPKMKSGYGHIRRTIGEDGEAVDCYVSEDFVVGNYDQDDQRCWIVRQVDIKTGEPDELKVMVGYPTREKAALAYLKEMPKRAFGGIHEGMASELPRNKHTLEELMRGQPFYVPEHLLPSSGR